MAEETRHGTAVQAREGGEGHALSERAGRPSTPLGWSTQVVGDAVPPKGAVGIVVAQGFSDPKVIRTTIEQGIERVAPGTVWVMRESERKGHAVNFAWQTFKSHGIEPFLAPLTPAWKGDGLPLFGPLPEGAKKHERLYDYDLRPDWRDIEMRATLERIIVFHDKSSNVTDKWIDYKDNGMSRAKIYVVQRGKVRTKKHKQGKAMS